MKEKDRERGEYVDSLVFRYQAGDSEALVELLNDFGFHPKGQISNYAAKYFHMLRYGRFSFDDSDSRTFISCFMKNPEAKAVRKAYQYADVRVAALKSLTRLIDQCKVIPDQDLLQDLRTTFVKQAKLYKHTRKDVYFPGYLANSFGYAFHNYIKKTFKPYDPFMHMYTDKQLIPMQEDVHVDDDTCIKLDERKFTHLPMLVEDDELGNSWVRGITCGDEFVKLTPLQRLIIKLYYQDAFSDRMIADKTGMHINTIHKQRKRAVQIIQDTMEELFKGGYE